MTDYRALLTDLLAWAEKTSAHYVREPAVIIQAREALEQPVAEGPTDEELWAFQDEWFKASDRTEIDVTEFQRATLARWGRPALADGPAVPEGREPAAVAKQSASAEGEVAELVIRLRRASDGASAMGWEQDSWTIARAADLLEQRHPTPVPVAIPGEEYHEDMGAVTWWRFPVDEPPWVGTPNDSDWPGYHTHFTPAPPEPATALPLPSGEVEP